MKKVGAIIVAAGNSRRMQGMDKLDLPLFGETVLEVSIRRFMESECISELVVVVRPDRVSERKAQLDGIHNKNKRLYVVAGGMTRFLSVQNGIAALSEDIEYVAIHDAARPFVTEELIARIIGFALEYDAAAPGSPVTDTVKVVDPEGFSKKTLDREQLRAMATPQAFLLSLYKDAVKNAGFDSAFDDCEVVERFGHPVFVVDGARDNIKITTTEDLTRVETMYQKVDIRIGHGYDVHRYESGRKLILGGVDIPYEMGLLGHSDADVLTHAVIDALLGAAALGDIGALFPDTDELFRNADSIALLREVRSRLHGIGLSVSNVDATIVCQRPKLAEFKEGMRKNIATALEIDISHVSVKATTEEGMGFTGEMKGISSHAIALLK